MHARHRVVADQRLPSFAVLARLREVEPGLDVFAGGAGMVAGRQQINIDGTAGTRRAGSLVTGQVDDRGDIARFHCAASGQ